MLIQNSGESRRKGISLLIVVVIILSLLLPLAQIAAQEGEDPELPRTDDVDAFPITPVEPSVNSDRALAAEVLIIQDFVPWGSYDAIQRILNRNGIPYDVIKSAQLAAFNLSPYKLLIVPSIQDYDNTNTFYVNWNNNLAKIESYVANGGKLWLSTCNWYSYEPLGPGGVVSSDDSDGLNDIVKLAHTWVKGVPNPVSGSSANHDSFSNLAKSTVVVAQTRTSGKPTLIDYPWGAGRVMMSGLTLEFAWYNNWDAKGILENSLLNMAQGFHVLTPLVTKNYCSWNLPGELESNNNEGTANGPLCDNKTFTSKANDTFDWYYFIWDGKGTVHIDVRNFTSIGQVNLYYQAQANGRLAFDFDQPSGNYDVDYTGTGKAGKYLIMVYTPNPGNQNYTIKVDIP